MDATVRLQPKRIESFHNSFFQFQEAKYNFGFIDERPGKDLIARTITFQVTEDCSLRCTYCYQCNKTKKSMTFEDAKKFIDLLIEESYDENSVYHISKTKAVILEFIGGEPLLEAKLIRRIIEYFKYKTITERHPWAANYVASMISNGLHYFQEDTQRLIKENLGKIDFAITLDGCQELHDSCRILPNGDGSYSIAEKACKHFMKNYNSNMSTKLTIAPDNVHWTSKAFINLYNLGYKNIHGNCIYESGWYEDSPLVLYNELKILADFILENDLIETTIFSIFDNTMFVEIPKEQDDNFCGADGSMIALDCSGNILPCQRFSECSMGKGNALTIGDLENGIAKIDKHKKNLCELSCLTRSGQSTKECMECPIASGCGWCTAHNLQDTGSINKRATYSCKMHKARALANMYFWAKIIKQYPNNELVQINVPKDIALEIISEEEYEMLCELQK